ncbi:efflux transporter outer membrane subunit [Jeongeupia chitinilytica]|uniref:AdeC/adeK/oprM family multidrug efflux complex outer membrane factor n=1 Tax=Jeongeupia chitinilytica TaxID=1041641 RepID=A0ABQ3GXX8_9NEIS|nr:efflux transporter outer membrane subunit [Jeongeupia chitinilytica]GHD60489.1 adeC/adeK/oprM family multidrug efflux complex outer membrane factor [Jeongeupia chitinilytica]
MKKKMISLAALTLLGGCAMGPDYQRPALDMPKQIGQGDAAVQPAALPAIKWENYFTDPALTPLIRDALANNRDLRVAVARVEEARALYGIQRADQLPTLNANGAAAASRVPASLSSTGQEMINHRYDANLGLLSYELDFWGRVRRLSEAAQANYFASEAAQKSFRSGLIADVVSGYYAAQALSEQLAFSRKTEVARGETLRLVQRRLDVGVAGRLELLEAQTALETAQAVSAQLAKQKDNARHALSVLIGRVVADDEIISGDATLLEKRPLPLAVPSGLSSDILLSRPDVEQAEQQLVAANANIGAARAAFFPKVTLVGSAGTASAELSDLFGSGSGAWSFLPTVSMPIFDGGRTRSGLELAEARKVGAVASYEKTIQVAFKEVADVLSDQQWLAAQLEAQQRLIRSQTARMDMAERRYKDGLTNYLEFLIAQRDYFASQQTLIEARRARLTVAAQAYKALGGE